MAVAAWLLVVRPSPVAFICATVFGIILRCLTIVCFFVTVQALIIAALPQKGGLLAGAEHAMLRYAPILEQVNLAILSAILVVLAYLSQLFVQYIYQKFVGKIIITTTSQLTRFQPEAKIFHVRRIANVMVTNSVKTSEILGFLLALGSVLSFFNVFILVALGVGGAAALAFFVWGSRWSLWHKRRTEAEKQAVVTSGDATAFIAADERARFNKQMSSGKEGAIIGLFTAFIIIVFVSADISIDADKAVHSVIIVFALRYAIIYVRELGRGVSGLLDLRAEKLVK